MSTNPFEIIEKRLSTIEELLIHIKEKSTEVETKENFTVKEVSSQFGVTTQTIHNYIKKGLIPASKIGRILFIKKDDLEHALTEVKSLKYKR